MKWWICIVCCCMLCGCTACDYVKNFLRKDEDLAFLIDHSEEFLDKVEDDERVRQLLDRAKEISYELRDDAKEKLSQVDYDKLLQEAKEIEEELKSILYEIDWDCLE